MEQDDAAVMNLTTDCFLKQAMGKPVLDYAYRLSVIHPTIHGNYWCLTGIDFENLMIWKV